MVAVGSIEARWTSVNFYAAVVLHVDPAVQVKAAAQHARADRRVAADECPKEPGTFFVPVLGEWFGGLA